MTEHQSSYRQIFKATSLFGGVQALNIGISIIRSKFIAVLLGPTGMGIAGLLTTTTSLVGALTNFGLGTSAVRNVAEANESGDGDRISRIVKVFRRLVWITGILGTLITLVLSPLLSRLTFGNKNYTIAFVWLSITLFFSQLTSGQYVLLQGLRKLKYLARANLLGSVAGLISSVPIYYFWRIDGIIPAIILSSILSLIISCFFASKIKIKKISVNRKETINEGRNMMQMGFILSISGLITTAISYLIRVFISSSGGLEDVGLYSAGFSIISVYVGLVFTAMSTDYYPRLSAIAHDNQQTKILINQQAEIAILILAPILSLFLIFINLVIIFLLSNKFLPVNGMIHWAALGIYFKAVSWSVGFIILAKGSSKVFFWTELLTNSYFLLLSVLGYLLFGLDGLGIAFLITYLLAMIQIYFIAKLKYGFLFSFDFYKIFSLQLLLGLSSFVIIKILPVPWAYFTGVPIICASSWFSFRELEKRIGLRNILVGYFKK